jgi:hypothetical protein
MPWDLKKAVAHLRANAQPESKKLCGQYTREAIEAGGVKLQRQNSAKDYGPSLKAVGFDEHAGEPPGGYTAGDVAVITSFEGHKHGHMQMFDGAAWISDFKQRDFWPGAAYRKTQPAFKIYRFAGLKPTVTPPLPPKPLTKTYPGNPLKLGSKGDDVRALQQRLRDLGWTISVDGDFGPRTRDAVLTFQKSRPLTADGIVGPKTWKAMFGA